MKKTLVIAAFAAITLAISITTLLAHRADANAPNNKAFIGAWERFAGKDSEGQPSTTVIPSYLIFSANGHFVQATNPLGREKLDKPVKEMTKEELLNRFESSGGTYGTYTLAGNTLTRKIVSVTNPNLEGTEIKQTYKFEGDLLILNSTRTKSEARFRRLK